MQMCTVLGCLTASLKRHYNAFFVSPIYLRDYVTRLTSNLRPTTCKCMHLVTHDHLTSRDKHSSHTIGIAIAKNPIIHGNSMALRFIELELLPIKVLHCGYMDLSPFLPLWSWLDPTSLIYELELYPIEIHQLPENELPMSRLSKVIILQTDQLTDRRTIHTPPKLYTNINWCHQANLKYYYYYYYYKRGLLRWRKIRRLQGHLTVSRRSQFRQTSA